MAAAIAKDRKNRILAKILDLLGYDVTIVSVEKNEIPYLIISAYGNPVKNSVKMD